MNNLEEFAKPFEQLNLGGIEINKDSKQELRGISHREMFSFINDLLRVRACKIQEQKPIPDLSELKKEFSLGEVNPDSPIFLDWCNLLNGICTDIAIGDIDNFVCRVDELENFIKQHFTPKSEVRTQRYTSVEYINKVQELIDKFLCGEKSEIGLKNGLLDFLIDVRDIELDEARKDVINSVSKLLESKKQYNHDPKNYGMDYMLSYEREKIDKWIEEIKQLEKE